MMTDPIADMLSRIRNAARARKREVAVPASRVKWEIAKILEREGFVEHALEERSPKPEIVLTLRFDRGAPVIRDLRRVSRPGRRLYAPWQDIPVVQSGFGFSIVSTSQGIMTGDEARRRRLGGELMAEVS